MDGVEWFAISLQHFAPGVETGLVSDGGSHEGDPESNSNQHAFV